MIKKIIKITSPVFFGYIGAGFAFGALASSSYKLPVGIPLLMSATIYAGGMQFISLELLKNTIPFLILFVMSVLINIRHLAYGITMIEDYNKLKGMKKLYSIFGLTDEVFALMLEIKEHNQIKNTNTIFFITLFSQLYWILGTVIGVIFASKANIPLKGMEFSLVVLFFVIFLDQQKRKENRILGIIGIISGILGIIVSSMFFSYNEMIAISIIFVLIISFLFKSKIEYSLTKEVDNK